jgi:hypothetical protein
VPLAFADFRFSAFSLTRLKKSTSTSNSKDTTITASGVSNMFDSDMQSLLNVSVSNNLLHRYTNSTLRHIEDNARLSMVVFVWQTLLLCCIADNIDDISDFVCF